jgi:Methylamine utilisation protein MauE
VIATAAGIVLGAVFVVAGTAKLARRAAWPVQADVLGVPRIVAPIVPWTEIVLGALLVAGVGSPWTAAAATLVLGAFTGLLLVRLDDDVRPPCACFGSWSARPLSWWSVARNAGLVMLALAAMSR